MNDFMAAYCTSAEVSLPLDLRIVHYNRLIACSFAFETRGLKGHGISEALHYRLDLIAT